MRRSFVLLVMAFAATVPAQAETTMVVGAALNEFVVGENDYGSLAGVTTGVGVAVRHIRGKQLQFTNSDLAPHTFQSVDLDASGVPRFGSTGTVLPGASVDVRGVSALAVSATGYAFRCRIHAPMRGTLIIVASP